MKNKNFIREIKAQNAKLKIILIAGTNGKTTTSKLVRTILEKDGKKVFQNEAGANLINGVASSLILNSGLNGRINKDFAIFEIDENSLPLVLKELTPDYLVILNLFRDQLDRYGEVNIIADKWDIALDQLPDTTTIVLNADDPQIAYLAKGVKAKVSYFGLNDNEEMNNNSHQAVDSIYCPNCGHKLIFKKTFFSHLGDWECPSCGRKRPGITVDCSPAYPLPGLYNKYNIHAAVLVAQLLNINEKTTKSALQIFSPAFGRQEIVDIDGKKVQLFLSKNPTSFNESLRTIASLNAKHLLLVLNDRIPDGRDVSWIWDTALEEFVDKFSIITVSGDRVYDMAVRIKYASNEFKIQNSKFKIEENLDDAIRKSLEQTKVGETLYILPTYSAMLEVRKIITGKKIL